MMPNSAIDEDGAEGVKEWFDLSKG